jgi:hypothetical protein
MRPHASNTSNLRASEDALDALDCSDVVTDVVTAEPGSVPCAPIVLRLWYAWVYRMSNVRGDHEGNGPGGF